MQAGPNSIAVNDLADVEPIAQQVKDRAPAEGPTVHVAAGEAAVVIAVRQL